MGDLGMSLENGILGYLSMKPLSGYDIKKLFNMTASYFWPADQAQIYRCLQKLMDDGLIEFKKLEQGETVCRKVYAVTPKGQDTLREWLISTTPLDFTVRSPYTMKLFFSGSLSREEQLGLLETQIAVSKKMLKLLKSNFEKNAVSFLETAQLPEDDPSLESATFAYRWGLLKGEAYIKFLKSIKKEILAIEAIRKKK